MAFTKEQHAANYLKKKQDSAWYSEHKENSLRSYHKNKKPSLHPERLFGDASKTARNIKKRAYNISDPIRKAGWKEKEMARKYGMTLDELRQVRSAILCEICQQPFSSNKNKHIDHCHKSGKYRGMLCSHCNLGLGRFKDSSELLLRAVEYLQKHQA